LLQYGSGSGPVVLPEPPASNTSRLVAVVLLAAVACGAILYITSVRPPPPAAQPPVVESVAPPPPVASIAPRPPEPVQTAVVHFDSDPQGARVKEDDAVVCESTPCDIQYKGPAADPTIEHLYVVTKHGFEVEKKLAKIWASPITVKLSKGH